MPELAGTGDTQQEIFGTLKGTAEITLTDDGAVAGLAIPTLLGEASQRVVEGWPGSGGGCTNRFQSAGGAFSVADGIAAPVDRLSLVSPELNMTARGDIDLLRRALDLRADPWLVTGSAGGTAALPVSMRIEGAWAAPRIYPDLPGILDNPAAAFDTLRTMGLPQQDGATVPDD